MVGNPAWEAVAGTGVVHTHAEIHPSVLPVHADEVSYVGIVVELDEGLLLVSRLVDHDAVDVWIGLPVTVTFQRVDDGLTLPLFRPVSTSA